MIKKVSEIEHGRSRFSNKFLSVEIYVNNFFWFEANMLLLRMKEKKTSGP